MKISKATIGLAVLLMPVSVFASEMDKRIVNLQAQVQAEVEPDILTVHLQAFAEKKMASDASNDVNEAVAKFLETVNKDDSVEVSVSGPRLIPVKTRHEIVPDDSERYTKYWVASVDITLTSKDKDAIAYMVSNAPEAITSKGSSFSVSTEKANELQSSLMTQAIADFQTKAYSVTEQFGFNCYDVVNLHVSDHQVGTSSMKRNVEVTAMYSDSLPRSSAPSYESSEKTLNVSVNGSIQMHETMNDKCWIKQ